MLVLSTRRFLQILFTTDTHGDMSRMALTIDLKMKENIHLNQHPVSSYVLQSGYVWCRIFLSP